VENAHIISTKAGLGAETAYLASSKLGVLLVKSGSLDKNKFKTLDAKAYAALLKTRQAIKLGDTVAFAAAESNVFSAASEITSLAPKE